jgi:hypothetical protein
MSFGHAQSLFDYGHSSFAVLRALLVGKIQLLQNPKRRNGGRVKSGDREAQEVDPTLWPNHRSANCQFKNAVTSFWINGGGS